MKPYYEHAGITIYHGDCREILPQMEKVGLVLTDPPYGIAISGGTWGRQFDSIYKAWDWEPFADMGLGTICRY